MTREEVARALSEVKRALDERVEVWRYFIGPDGVPTGRRIYRGFFTRRRVVREPDDGEMKK